MTRQSVRSLVFASISAVSVALFISASGAFADDEHGRGASNGQVHHEDVATLVTPNSPQPSPTALSAQPTPTAVSPQPTPTSGPSEASDNSLETRHGIAGEVIDATVSGQEGTLTIRTESDLIVNIQVTGDTDVRGQGNDEITLSDIAPGDRINVVGTPTEAADDATIVADQIIVHPAHDEQGGNDASAGDDADGHGHDGGRGHNDD